MFIDKTKQIEVALGIADNTGEIAQLKQADIAVVILNTFLLQFGAFLGRQLIILAGSFRQFSAILMVAEQRFKTMRTLAIRATRHFHLQYAEIDAQLQFVAAI